MAGLTHVGEDGRTRMVDIGDKPETDRVAVASGRVACSAEALALVRCDEAPKGAVIATAELAGIMAAKRTADLIPLCHPLALSKVRVAIEPDEDEPGFAVRAEVRTRGATGVEMEALTAVSVACLTIYDMLKAVDRGMEIGPMRVEEKDGGRSGHYVRQR